MRSLLLFFLLTLAAQEPETPDSWFAGLDTTAFLLVDKQKLTLSMIKPGGRIERVYRVACGVNYGNKTKKGDFRTPEGRFPINQLLNAAGLSHDFGDGKGPIANAYGPWFLRLDVPGFITIGIHGTHLPESIGSRATEGCIRMRNEDILDLKKRVALGMPVVILPDTLTQPVRALHAILAASEPAETSEPDEPDEIETAEADQTTEAIATEDRPNCALIALAVAAGLVAGIAAVQIYKRKRHANL